MLEAIILGLIQGLAEFIPISSSGHIIVFEKLLGAENLGSGFGGAIHLATSLSALIYFKKEIIAIFKALRNPKDKESTKEIDLLKNIIVAVVPVLIITFVLQKLGLTDLWKDLLSIGISSIFFGVLLYLSEIYNKRILEKSPITLKKSLLIGLSQIIAALLPGTSRSGITLTTSLFLNIKREDAAKFTFIVSIPITALAGIYEIFFNSGVVLNDAFFAAFIAAFFSGLFVIYTLLFIIKKYSLLSISIYKIIFGICAIVLFFVK